MKLKIIAVSLVALGTLQDPVVAQDWSSWITSNNRDVQYRWLSSIPSGSKECHLQLRDLKRKPPQTTIVGVLIDYKYEHAESTRDVVAIMDLKDEDQGPKIVYNCVSVDGLRVTGIVR
jgi:hypothetical protein